MESRAVMEYETKICAKRDHSLDHQSPHRHCLKMNSTKLGINRRSLAVLSAILAFFPVCASTGFAKASVKGNGITPANFNAPFALLNVEPAAVVGTNASLGRFAVITTPAVGSSKTTAFLAIYQPDPLGRTNVADKLVATAQMTTTNTNVTPVVTLFAPLTSLKGTNNTTYAIPQGKFRAEATIYAWTPATTTTPSKPVEAGGAAANFQVGSVFLTNTSTASGSFRINITGTPSSTNSAAVTAVKSSVASTLSDSVKAVTANLNKYATTNAAGTPYRAPWKWTLAQTNSGLTASATFTLTDGAVYTDNAYAVQSEFYKLASLWSTTIPSLSGSVRISSYQGITFTPNVPLKPVVNLTK